MCAEVAVVGAGIAGLSAAFELRRSGHKVVVLEASRRIGGRMSTDMLGGHVWNRGAQFLSSEDATTEELLGHMRMRRHIAMVPTPTSLTQGPTLKPIEVGRPWQAVRRGAVSLATATRYTAGACRTRAWRGLDATKIGDWEQLDQIDAGDLARRWWGPAAFSEFYEPVFRGRYYGDPRGSSAAFLAWTFARENRPHEVVTVNGGLGRLPVALSHEVRVQLHTPVNRIVAASEGVRIGVRGGLFHADYVVLAPTANVARSVLVDPPEWMESVIEASYLPTISVGVVMELESPLSSAMPNRLFVPVQQSEDVSSVVIEPHRIDGDSREVLFTVIFAPGAASMCMEERDSELALRTQRALVRLLPGVRGRAMITAVQRWRCGMPCFPRGSMAAVRRYRRAQRGSRFPVVLAGDYLGAPTIEAAASSGKWAAGEIDRMAGVSPFFSSGSTFDVEAAAMRNIA